MATIEEQFPIFSAEDSIRQKDWAAGTSKVCESLELIIPVSGTPEWRMVSYAPAWLKMFDEVLVNALDQMVKMSNEQMSDRVTRITISFVEGKFRVENNGRGIPCEMHTVAGCWLPELLIGRLFQSSNHVKRTGTVDEIVGGVNGIGSKIPQLLSSEFTLETFDLTRARWYYQQWREKMTIRGEPKIFRTRAGVMNSNLPDLPAALASRAYPHTTIAFSPDYSHFGYGVGGSAVSGSAVSGSAANTLAPNWAQLTDIIHTRVALAACFVKFVSPATTIVFNGVEIHTTLETLARDLYATDKVYTAVVKPKTTAETAQYKYPWNVVIAASAAPRKAKGSVSIINGIVVRSGKHIAMIQDQIMDRVKDQVMKTFNDNNINFTPAMIKKYINVMVCAQIPSPNWEGQRKDTFVIDNPKKLAGYVLRPEFIRAVCEGIQPLVIESIFGGEMRKMAESVRNKSHNWKKYWPAVKEGTRESTKCTLFVLEGDSAAVSVKNALLNTIGMDYYGVISTQGVIINARKESTIFPGVEGRYIKQSEKLKKNEFIRAWYAITGMNPYAMYDPSTSTYSREISQLNYGRIVLFTDQDYDGVGNIDPLMLNFARLMFPRLVEQGYFHVFETPKTRLFIRGKTHEFYNDEDYAAFLAANNIKSPQVQYYKGIGSHNPEQLQRMVSAANKTILRYQVDCDADAVLETYYGMDTTPRKVELSKPLAITSAEVTAIRKRLGAMPISTHIIYDAGQFQRDNIDRKLPSAIDGFNQSSRMIYHTARSEVNGKTCKVSELGGAVSKAENYAHGETSLYSNIIRKAFVAIGGRQLPMFYPHGQFGSRLGGADGAANPRYIKVELIETYPLIYPEADYSLLEFNFDDGRRYEPKYFVPIIPMAILDNLCQPAHGWKVEIYARDVFKVIESVRMFIHSDRADMPLPSLPLATQGHTGTIRTWAGKQYSVGRYELRARSIIILELPFTVWTDPYIEELEKLRERDSRVIGAGKIINRSTDNAINIEIPLTADAMETLNTFAVNVFDGPEEYFCLRKSLHPNINLVGDSKQVIEFQTYERVINYWYPFRRKLYIDRTTRELELLALKIIWMENIIRYIEESAANNMPRKTRVAMIEHLSANNYMQINAAILKSPGFIKTEDLRSSVLCDSEGLVPSESRSSENKSILTKTTTGYKYLTSLSDDDKSAESYEEYKTKLAKLRGKHDSLSTACEYGKFRGARVWLDELTALEENIRYGIKTKWEFGNHNKFTYAD